MKVSWVLFQTFKGTCYWSISASTILQHARNFLLVLDQLNIRVISLFEFILVVGVAVYGWYHRNALKVQSVDLERQKNENWDFYINDTLLAIKMYSTDSVFGKNIISLIFIYFIITWFLVAYSIEWEKTRPLILLKISKHRKIWPTLFQIYTGCFTEDCSGYQSRYRIC